MPRGVHKTQAKTYRPDPDLHARAKTAAGEVGSNLNAHICAFLRWLVHDTDELPARPNRRVEKES